MSGNGKWGLDVLQLDAIGVVAAVGAGAGPLERDDEPRAVRPSAGV